MHLFGSRKSDKEMQKSALNVRGGALVQLTAILNPYYIAAFLCGAWRGPNTVKSCPRKALSGFQRTSHLGHWTDLSLSFSSTDKSNSF
jgi:hypothetical protein